MILSVCGLGVCLPAGADEVRVSHGGSKEALSAIRAQVEPIDSLHRPAQSFFPHKGTTEWAEYHFDSPRTVRSTSVFWTVDHWERAGRVLATRAPVSWEIFTRQGDRWVAVSHPTSRGTEPDRFNRVTFDSVETTAVRIEIRLQKDHSGGIVAWDFCDDPLRLRTRRRQAVLARLEHFRFHKNRSPLVERLIESDRFSQAGRDYLAELDAIEQAADTLQKEIDAKATPTDDVLNHWESAAEKLAGRLDGILDRQIKSLDPILFFTRFGLKQPNAINCHIWQSVPERWGCSLRVFDPKRPEAAAKTIFSDSRGSIFDANLSRDARTVFFSFRRKDEPCWQIYEIGIDGRGLKKISRDPSFHEVGAIETPDGRLAFVSTRREGFTLCQPGPTSNLYLMERDGSAPRCVSQNTLSDFSPQMLDDGRVLFSRWEYIDRDLTYRQSLWTQMPDGRRYQLFFGNTIRDCGSFWQCRPLPGFNHVVVGTFAPHHRWPHGAIGLIDASHGLETPRGIGFTWLTHDYDRIGDTSFRFAYRDPFPVTDHLFLAADGRERKGTNRFGIVLLDLFGNKRPVCDDPEQNCHGPIVVRPRPVPHQVPFHEPPRQEPKDPVDAATTPWGTMFVADVYDGAAEIERGQVRYIQIMEQVRKKADLERRAYDQSPVMSYGTYYAKRCWGRVPVERDGSAHFRVPALREIYFQLLDAEGRELQRQTSAVQVMPGETQACIGCHEPRNQAPPPKPSTDANAAWYRRPSVPKFPEFAPDGIVDFVTVVQPVLDRYCVECHSGVDPDGGYDLSGDKTRFFNMAYDHLLGRSRSYRQHNMQTGQMLSAEAAKGKPLVHYFWLLRTPSGVNRPFWTGSHASRLLEYLTKEHCGQEIPLEARERVYLWIDANVPYYGTYDHTRPLSSGYRDLFTDPGTGKDSDWFAKRFLPVYQRRCVECHGPIPHPGVHGGGKGHQWEGRYAWINLSRPEFSSALTAHLARAAGGRGLGMEKGAKEKPLFNSTDDPDYRAMLEAIREGHRGMMAHPRVDGPKIKE